MRAGTFGDLGWVWDAHGMLGRRLPPSLLAMALLVVGLGGALPLQAQEDWDVTVPRGKPRIVEFETDVGTWMSLDVSPDGRSIVFNLLGHLYRISMEGGEAENLTGESGMALNFHPRYSPDGSTIAFVSDRAGQEDLWLMNADGSDPRPLAVDRGSRPSELAWTPDGEHVVARVRGGESGIWLYRIDGGSASRVVAGGSWPAISPDGENLYYQVSSGHGGRVGGSDLLGGSYQVRRMTLPTGQVVNVTSGEQRQMMKGSSGGAIAPEISPDGRWLAFARRIPDGTISYKGQKYGPRTALWIRNLETGEERKIMDPVEQDMAEGVKTLRVLPAYDWMPDAESIVISQGGGIRRVYLEDGRVETIPFTARVHRRMTERVRVAVPVDDGDFRARFLRWHTLAPDGGALAFQAVGRIWIQDHPGAPPRRLTRSGFPGFEYAPVWSPDGQWVAFTTWSDSGGGHVWKAPISGGDPVRLSATPGEYVHPDWSRDGSKLVVARGSGATLRGRTIGDNEWFDVLTLSAERDRAEMVVARVSAFGVAGGSDDPSLVRPTWGPEGRIYFVEPVRDGRGGALTSVDPEGGDRRTHLTFGGSGTDVAVSPDGRWAAFVQGLNVHLAPIPEAGAEVPEGVRAGRPGVRAVSSQGGLHPRWRADGALEYGASTDHVIYRVGEGELGRRSVDLQVARDIPDGTIALTGARILTMGEAGVLEEGTLVVEGARIRCVGECSTQGVDRVVDVSGQTIMPGLVDTHAHHYDGHGGMVPVRSPDYAVYLAYGVTTTHDPAASSLDLFTAGELIRAGEVVGPRTFSTGESLRSYPPLSDHDATRAIMATRRSMGANQSKLHFHARREVRQWVVETGRELGLNITSEGDDFHADLAMVMDGQTGIEHMLSYMPVYDDVTRFFGQAGVCYNPTWLGAGPGAWDEEYWFAEASPWKDPKQRRWVPWRDLVDSRRIMLRPTSDYSFAMAAQAMADMLAEGACGSFGGHFQQPGVSTHWHLWGATRAMTPLEALRIGTLGGAEMLGMDGDLGSLEPGKLADLMVLRSNPLDDIRATTDLHLVMRGGVLYDAETLDEIWPRNRPFGPVPWAEPEVYPGDDRPTDYWDRGDAERPASWNQQENR